VIDHETTISKEIESILRNTYRALCDQISANTPPASLVFANADMVNLTRFMTRAVYSRWFRQAPKQRLRSAAMTGKMLDHPIWAEMNREFMKLCMPEIQLLTHEAMSIQNSLYKSTRTAKIETTIIGNPSNE